MDALIRPFAAILSLCFSAAYFGPAHRMLPPKVRISSEGFVSVVITYFLASVARHAGLAEHTLTDAVIGAAVWLLPLALVLGSRGLDYLCLAMATSVGVDLTMVILGAVGLLKPLTLSPVVFAWEVAAILVGAMRLSSLKSKQRT